MPELADRFDLIGFDPRGVGLSDPIDCVDDAAVDASRALDITPDDAAEMSILDQEAKTLVAGCVERTGETILRNLHTENAARDLDGIREALGEEKLSYIGISYGTFLGATYASFYPDRVRAFVLDSALAPAESRFTKMEQQASGYEMAVERFFAHCAADASCAFHGGSDVAVLQTAWDGLLAKIRAEPFPAGTRMANELDFGLLALNTLRGADWTGLAEALTAMEAGDGTKLLVKADAEIGRLPNGAYVQFLEPLLAIGCSDVGFPAGTTMEQVDTFTKGLEQKYPRMGRAMFLPWFHCTAWPYPHTAAPLGAKDAPPLLIVGGRYDPATIYEDASTLRDALGNGSHLLTFEGEGHASILRDQCVRDAAQAFLLDPGSAPVATCPGE
jgi:pimeloyl-ACP methyl ester carboxylesterase